MNSVYGLLWVKSIELLLIVILLGGIYRAFRSTRSPKTQRLWGFLLGILMSSIIINVRWCLSLLIKSSLISGADMQSGMAFMTQFVRLLGCLEHTLIFLFIIRLSVTDVGHYIEAYILKPTVIVFLLFVVSCYGSVYYGLQYGLKAPFVLSEACLSMLMHYYVIVLVLAAMILCLYCSYCTTVPKVLRNQCWVLFCYFFLPYLVTICASTHFFVTVVLRLAPMNRYWIIALGDMFYMAGLCFCANRVVLLRFLNINRYVYRKKSYHFVNDFKDTLISLGNVQSFEHVYTIAKKFYTDAFGVPFNTVRLCIRTRCMKVTNNHEIDCDALTPIIDDFLLDEHNSACVQHLEAARVLIRDELEFDYFYDEAPFQKKLLEFLDALNADLFVPMYEHSYLIGYIVVTRNARPHELFSSIERDEMVVFANYVSAIVNFLQHRNLRESIEQKHQLEEALYTKQREIEHYKESVRVLLQGNAERMMGVGWYSRRKGFSMNQTLRSMIVPENTPLADAVELLSLKRLCAEVDRYGIERSTLIHTTTGRTLQCLAVSHEDRSHIVVIAYYTDSAERCTIPFQQLNDLSAWEYALYLQTTRSGAVINQLIPGNTPALLNFKIDLFKSSLRNQALLLEVPLDDVAPMVEILHHISLRSRLHTITFVRQERSHEVSGQIFGFDALVGKNLADPLLTTLHETGTISIVNIEYMSLEAQERLAEFIVTGTFRPFLSNRYIRSNVRIICSSPGFLQDLVEKRLFSAALFKALNNLKVTMPSFSTIDRHELLTLIHQMSAQQIGSQELTPTLALNSRDIEQIIQQSSSIQTIKERVAKAVQSKLMKKTAVCSDSTAYSDTAHAVINPEMLQAARLGKRALHNRQLLLFLWNHFKSQTKIATLLNVHRSSVNRRCKEFNIDVDAVSDLS